MTTVVAVQAARWDLPLICALLRGETPAWPGGGATSSTEDFMRLARTHGAIPLLDQRFSAGDAAAADLARTWPAPIRQACHRDFIAHSVLELARRRELLRVLAAFASAGLAPLILKGSALAYSHYPQPALRPRGDTDLLMPPGTEARTAQVLQQLGYSCPEGSDVALVSYQTGWSRTDSAGISHDLDVHRRINNAQLLAKMLSYDELAATAVAVPALGAHARALSPVHALLFACVHRAGHANMPFYSDDDTFFGGDRLIWLYDIHLLIGAMPAQELELFASAAAAKQLKAICQDALLRTRDCFATPLPATLLAALQPTGRTEPSARYLTGNRLQLMWGDLMALGTWGERFAWLTELVFPPAAHMRSKYPQAAIGWLPVLYARRALGGVAKVFRRGQAD